jgi:hypothetical protein
MNTPYKFAICVLSPLLLASIALGQQDYVGRYDVYTGYMYLNSPLIGLAESGFHAQVGMNPTKWYSMGLDFSEGTGDTTLTNTMLKSSVQQLIATQLAPLKAAGLLPANYEPAVPLHSQTQTYAVGPQINYRHFRSVTLFIHPDVGAIHENTIPHPNVHDPIAVALVTQLAPSGTKEEYTCFYGVGGGIDFNVTRHFGLKVHVDFVHDHLFGDVLNGRNSVRLSVGPLFHMGKNVAEQK